MGKTRMQSETITLGSNQDIDFYFSGSANNKLPAPEHMGWSVWVFSPEGDAVDTLSVTAKPLSFRGTAPTDTAHDVSLWTTQAIVGTTELIEKLGDFVRCAGVRLSIVSTGSGRLTFELYRGSDN